MKTTLAPEQSATLIAKGISADKASGQGEKIYKPITLQNGSIKRVFDGYTPIFTLADIIGILPKEVKIHCDGDTLSMIYHCGQWRVGYSNCAEHCNHTKVALELIDALYSLLCWAIGHGHIDLTK